MSFALAEVRFDAHCGLKSDIVPSPKSAKKRHARRLQLKFCTAEALEVATACTQGKRTQHGKPHHGVVRDGQPEAREGQIGRHGVPEPAYANTNATPS
jgi:hypothetical protein